MHIRLSDIEMVSSDIVAEKRWQESFGRKPNRGQPDVPSLPHHKMGSYAEFAVAKALNLYPGFTVNHFAGPDIEPNIEVRSAPRGRLILNDQDNSFRKYVLVLGEAPSLELVGWIWGYEGQKKEFLRDLKNGRPPAYFVPREALRPMSTFNEN
jgi:hypothetical protein